MPTYKDQEKTDQSWLKDNSQRLLAYNQLPKDYYINLPSSIYLLYQSNR